MSERAFNTLVASVILLAVLGGVALGCAQYATASVIRLRPLRCGQCRCCDPAPDTIWASINYGVATLVPSRDGDRVWRNPEDAPRRWEPVFER